MREAQLQTLKLSLHDVQGGAKRVQLRRNPKLWSVESPAWLQVWLGSPQLQPHHNAVWCDLHFLALLLVLSIPRNLVWLIPWQPDLRCSVDLWILLALTGKPSRIDSLPDLSLCSSVCFFELSGIISCLPWPGLAVWHPWETAGLPQVLLGQLSSGSVRDQPSISAHLHFQVFFFGGGDLLRIRCGGVFACLFLFFKGDYLLNLCPRTHSAWRHFRQHTRLSLSK